MGLALAALAACGAGSRKRPNDTENDSRTRVKLETNVGDITLALYDETPGHRDNFIRLVREGVYDSTLFHRVIKQFMIQGGDPDSKHAPDSVLLGNGDVGYSLPAEFRPGLFHRRGVLAAAREGDDVNPRRESSGCQFYIVTGHAFTEAQLQDMAIKRNEQREKAVFDSLRARHREEALRLREAGNGAGLLALQDTLRARACEQVDREGRFAYSPEQVQAYTTVGGAPHLDGAYTVFGEVTDGMDVVERIEVSRTDRADRPLENMRILKATVVAAPQP